MGMNESNQLSDGGDGHDLDDLDADANAGETDGGDTGDLGVDPWTDAGVADETLRAEEKTKVAIVRLAENAATGEEKVIQARQEPDLVKRAKALAALQVVSFPDVKYVTSSEQKVLQAAPTDGNRWAAFDGLFGNERPGRPHLDTFRGRLVDHRNEIIDERYPVVTLVKALQALNLKGTSADACRSAFKEWALEARWNNLISSFEINLPQWDGVPRLETAIIDLFKCFDTPLNRRFSKYFWLSLYCRIMQPGCNAPMVLSLFGAQNAGKSYFSKLLCQILTDKRDSDSVQLDLSGDKLTFLREITGNSIIANVGEMTGFNRGDMNKIKNFITRTSDNLHFKFEGNFDQPRQWITVMDGNSYTGLQRDETGNRRFYPMFVGQLPDKDGQPAWKADFTADFTGFKDAVWQLMAECRVWLDENGDEMGYRKFVGELLLEVAEFNREEREKNRGTVRDYELDVLFPGVLLKCIKAPRAEKKGAKRKGVIVYLAKFMEVYEKSTKHKLNFDHLQTKMSSVGAEYGRFTANLEGYFFPQYDSVEAMNNALVGSSDTDDAIEGAPVETTTRKDAPTETDDAKEGAPEEPF